MTDERGAHAMTLWVPRNRGNPMPLTYSIRRFTFALMAFFSFASRPDRNG
jgi:hypothetical protein